VRLNFSKEFYETFQSTLVFHINYQVCLCRYPPGGGGYILSNNRCLHCTQDYWSTFCTKSFMSKASLLTFVMTPCSENTSHQTAIQPKCKSERERERERERETFSVIIPAIRLAGDQGCKRSEPSRVEPSSSRACTVTSRARVELVQ
jgi:hypothetical protein